MTTNNQEMMKMATAAKRIAPSEKVTPEAEGDVTEAEVTDAPVVAEPAAAPAAKRTRRTPVAVEGGFEVVGEELPANPPRKKSPGGNRAGTSKWVKILEAVKAGAPKNAWVKIMTYPTPVGANGARKGMADLVEAGKSPFPELEDGFRWIVDARKFDVTVVDEDTKVEVTERHSNLYVKMTDVEGEDGTEDDGADGEAEPETGEAESDETSD